MRNTIIVAALLVLFGTLSAQTPAPPDNTNVKRDLYVVATAHLDTQWRWTIQNTINEYVLNTFRDNFKLMEQYPHYTFSFEGAFKYMLLKEYYPDLYKQLKKYIDNGQWRVSGSWVDAVDVNMPSFESLVRQTLYGNGFYKKEFGKTSRDIMLPDCFGFGYALPSIAAHCGLKSFSTQKLSWGSAYGVPFDIGLWQGVDGSTIVAAINPGSYGSEIRGDLTRDTTWLGKINRQGEKSGLYAAYKYFGTGDVGGSPDSLSVDWLDKSMKSDGPVKVHSIGADDIVDVVAASDMSKLPQYNGELVMTRHGVGCYTSEAAMKRWNRKNEQLADAAERAAVIAHLFGGYEYPREELKDTWIRFLWHQFHDDLTGTSIPQAYEFSWNDELLCQNRFASILTNAVSSASRAFDTEVKGQPIIVFNPLSADRNDIVEVETGRLYDVGLQIYGPDGKAVPSQTVYRGKGDIVSLLFAGSVKSIGYSVYGMHVMKNPPKLETGLKITDSSLENQRYLVKINDNGDVSSIYDKLEKKELLAAPITYQLIHDKPKQWPAWEIQYEDIIAPPVAIVGGKPEIKIIENGPVRVALQITRKTDKSKFVTVVRLAAGDAGNRVEFDNDIDWYERETLLKAAFNLTTPNDSVTYDIGLGTIKRGLNHKELYEVPGQQWADMTAKDGSYGVAVLNDCKYGWDHPDANTLRLSLIHTPGVYDNWAWVKDEASQDNGHHKFLFAVAGHKGDWRESDIIWQAAAVNQPLIPFLTTPHKGAFKEFSLLTMISPDLSRSKVRAGSPGPVMVNAVKLAEGSDEIVVRCRELKGKANNAILSFFSPILKARQVNGCEEQIRDMAVAEKSLVALDLKPYQPKALALTATNPLKKPLSTDIYQPLKLDYNMDGISLDSDRKDGDFDGHGNTLAGELLPDTVMYNGIPFVIGPKNAGALNVVKCAGQTIQLPPDVRKMDDSRKSNLYLLLAAVDGPTKGVINSTDLTIPRNSDKNLPNPFSPPLPVPISVQDYARPLGQWNNRLVGGSFVEEPGLIDPEYINRAPVAWYGSHLHNAKGENEAYRFSYLYTVKVIDPLFGGYEYAKVTLPNNPQIRLVAATVLRSDYNSVTPARPLYDLTNTTLAKVHAERTGFLDSMVVSLSTPICGAKIHYTLDGSEPTMSSTEYGAPFVVRQSATLKTAALIDGVDNHVTAVKFTRLVPREPAKVDSLAPGMVCRYFEGAWKKLPNFDSLKVVKEAVLDSVGLPSFARPEDYGLVFTGYVKVAQDGLYDFFITSDDGSSMLVDDSLFINNDDIHGDQEETGSIALKAGIHPIVVHMFQGKGGKSLSVAIQGPGMAKQNIPRQMLFHKIEGKAGTKKAHRR
jgi:alpha-mannosidase